MNRWTVRRWTKVNIWRCWKQSNKTPKQIAKKWWQNKPQNMSAPKETWIGKTCVAWQIFNLQGCLELLGLGEKQVGQQLRCGKELVKVKTASFDRSWFLIAYPFHKETRTIFGFWLMKGMEHTIRKHMVQTWHESLDFFGAHLSSETSQDGCWQVDLAGWFGRSMCLVWISMNQRHLPIPNAWETTCGKVEICRKCPKVMATWWA